MHCRGYCRLPHNQVSAQSPGRSSRVHPRDALVAKYIAAIIVGLRIVRFQGNGWIITHESGVRLVQISQCIAAVIVRLRVVWL